MLEWTARIRCNECELGGSFSVLIFIGMVPDDPKQWGSSPSCVGIHDVYVGKTSRDNASQEEAEVEGFVALNEGLLKHYGVNELTPNVVVPFLKNELHWRVQNVSCMFMYLLRSPCPDFPSSFQMKGVEAHLQSLEVVVLATPTLRVPGETFPSFGEPHFYHDVTHGRPGGSRRG